MTIFVFLYCSFSLRISSFRRWPWQTLCQSCQIQRTRVQSSWISELMALRWQRQKFTTVTQTWSTFHRGKCFQSFTNQFPHHSIIILHKREDESAAWWWTVWEHSTRKSRIQRISLGLMSSFKFAFLEVWLDGIEDRRKVDGENSDKWTCFFQGEYMRFAKRVSVVSLVLLLCLYVKWYGSKWGFICFTSLWRIC